MAVGTRVGSTYELGAPEPVGELGSLLHRLVIRAAATDVGPVIVGFDFPIGLPAAYAQQVGVERFLDALPEFGGSRWPQFFDLAVLPSEISLRRPFYPFKPGGTKQKHLTDGLGAESMSSLLRLTDRNRPHRVDACATFWTLGGKQVGRAAIAGWRDVLAPVVRDRKLDLAFWPFDGDLDKLLQQHLCIVVETYPAEACLHLGFRPPGSGWSKRKQEDRKGKGRLLIDWARALPLELIKGLQDEIQSGFGDRGDGDDRFDAVIGLMGMVNVLLGQRTPGPPKALTPPISTIENWIFGEAG